MNKAICGSKESAVPHDELETWKETVLVPTLSRYSPNNIYNGDETALSQVIHKIMNNSSSGSLSACSSIDSDSESASLQE